MLFTVRGVGQLTTGACVSSTVTVNVQVASGLLGLVSDAVSVTVVLPTGKKEPGAGLAITVTDVQLSEAAGNAKFTMAPHCPDVLLTVMGEGQFSTGACISNTVTVNVQVASGLLGLVSDAVTVTVVVPTGKKEPGAGFAVTVAPPQLSVAEGNAKFTIAPHCPGSLFTEIFEGQLSWGASVSCTVTLNWQEGPAVVVTVTRVVPTGKKVPEAGLTETVPQVPLVTGAGKLTIAPH